MEQTKLYKHQEEFIKFLPKRYLLAWDVGVGKTKAATIWLDKISTSSIIVTPKALVKQWVEALLGYFPNSKEYKINETHYVIYSGNKKLTIVSKERFKSDLNKLHNECKYDAFVGDEAHLFAGQKSQISKAVRVFIKAQNIENILLLTATPYTSSPWSIYTLAGHLGYFWDYIKFRNKYFREQYFGRRVVYVPRDNIKEEISNLINHIGKAIHISECFDIPEQVYETEVIAISDKIKKKIEEYYDPNPIVKFGVRHQLENGVLVQEDLTFDNNKLDRIKDLALENKKMIVVCRYNIQLRAIVERLAKIKKVFILNGKTDDRASVVKEAEKCDDCVVVINSEVAEGYELPSFPLMVFASMSYSYVKYKQMTGRILRANKLKKNVYIHLVSDGEIDQAVYDSVKKKEDFSMAMYLKDRYGIINSNAGETISNSLHEMDTEEQGLFPEDNPF